MTEWSMPEAMHILLVEDNEHDRAAFHRALRKSEITCQISECHKAEQALELLCSGERSFDLVVIDYGLPGMSGMELFERASVKTNLPPFVMLTGSGSEQVAVEALKAGVADYVVKDPAQSYLQLLPVILAEVIRRHQEKVGRQRAEKALAKSNQKLWQTLESITDAYFAMDEQWRIVEVNPAAERELFCRPAEELIGRVLWELYPKAKGSVFERQYHRAVTKQAPVHFEGHSAIVEKWWETHAYPRGDRLEIYLKDITERKLFEQELKQANEVLDRLRQGKIEGAAVLVLAET